MQERLRTFHNTRGAQFEAGQITQTQWDAFKAQWMQISERVSERIATLRDNVFRTQYAIDTSKTEDDAVLDMWRLKKEQLKTMTTYSNDINTIWQ